MQYTYTYDSDGTNEGTDPGAGTVNAGSDPGAGVVNSGTDPGDGTVNLGTDSETSVKIKNVTIQYYKRIGDVVVEFDARDLGWTGGSADWQIKILEGESTRLSVTETVKTNWKRYSATWHAGVVNNLQDLGDISFIFRIIDEDGTATDITKVLGVDLDPNEFFLDVISAPSSTDSTPDIVWTLDDLFSEQRMVPTVTVGASTATTLTVTFTDGTTESPSARYINLNGVKFSDSSVVMNSYDASKAYWKRAKSYTITAPTMESGGNNYSIDLNCTTI